jgi:hypothetical protein
MTVVKREVAMFLRRLRSENSSAAAAVRSLDCLVFKKTRATQTKSHRNPRTAPRIVIGINISGRPWPASEFVERSVRCNKNTSDECTSAAHKPKYDLTKTNTKGGRLVLNSLQKPTRVGLQLTAEGKNGRANSLVLRVRSEAFNLKRIPVFKSLILRFGARKAVAKGFACIYGPRAGSKLASYKVHTV